MPMVIDHPGIPGAFQVVKLPSERDNSISVGVTLSKAFTRATDSLTVTVRTSAAIEVSTDVTISFDPSYGAEVTAGAFSPTSGSVTTFSFPVNIAKTGSGSFPISVVVSIGGGGSAGVGSARFTVLTSTPTTIGAPTTEGRIDANRISWTASVDPFLSFYNVYRNISSSASAGAVFLGKTVDNSYVDIDIPQGTQPNYWYFVTEVDLAGNEGVKQALGTVSAPRQVIDNDIQNAAIHLAKTDFGLILAGGNAFGVGGNNFIVPQLIAGDISAAAITATKLGIVTVAYDTGQFTSNSPSGGFVAWGSGLRLIRNGLSYPDGVPPASATTFFASGNTNKSVIWWKASAPTVIQADNRDATRPPAGTSFDGKYNPAAGDVVLGFNYSGTFTPQWSGTVITGDQILTNGVTANHINVTELAAINSSLGQIYAGRIQDNSDPASSFRGMRVSSTFTDAGGGVHSYGIPTNWKNATSGYFIDLAADGATSDSIFMKVGPFITIDLASGGSSRFHGDVYADTLIVPDFLSGATIGQLDSSGLKLLNTGMRVKSPGMTVQSNGVYGTLGDRISIGDPFTGPAADYALFDAISVWDNTHSQIAAYLGTYTTTGTGASDEPALATEFPTSSQSVTRTSSGSSSSANMTSIDLGTLAPTPGPFPGPTNKKYTFNYTVTLAETSFAPATTCQVTADAAIQYSTDGGSTWITMSTRSIVHLITTTTTQSDAQSFSDIADFAGSSNPAHIQFRASVTLTVVHPFTGSTTATVTAIKVTFHNAGSGGVTIRNLRLNAFADGSGTNPHMTLEPVAIPGGGLVGGRKGDFVMGTDGQVRYYNGAAWAVIAAGTGAVNSVFGRSGIVVATTGDYTFAQIGSKPTTLSGYGITDTVTNTVFGRSGTVVATTGDYTFAQIGSKPTTIAGYGITDFNSLGDARWSLLAHTHTFASITSKPTTVSGYGITDIVTQDGARFGTAFNSLLVTGFYNASGIPTNSPGSTGYGAIIVAHGIDTGLQIYSGYQEDNLWFRGWFSSGAGFTTWRKVWHDGNMASASVSAAANTLVQRDGNGYIFNTYINTTDDTSSGLGLLVGKIGGGDNYHRSYTGQTVANLLGTSSVVFPDVYTSGWHRNTAAGTGLYNQANNQHWYSESSGTYWTHASPNANGGIVMRAGYASTIHGYVGFWDSSGFGFLDYGGNWALRINTTGTGAAGGQLYGDWTVRDIHAVRTTDGVIYLGNTGSRYLYYDGANYNLVNAAVYCPDFVLA